jgi:hypothetical protein
LRDRDDSSVEVTLEDSHVPEKPVLTDPDLARYKAYTNELGSKIKAAFARAPKLQLKRTVKLVAFAFEPLANQWARMRLIPSQDTQ